MRNINHASLFSGIGGFDLAAQWMGWNNMMQCEIDEFCMDILCHYFPNTTHYGEIRDISESKYGIECKGKIDVLTGGFPCQPFSQAGKRKGTDDNRFLWPEMLRVIREIQPTWVVAENVRGILTLQDGMVFEQVCTDLETNGYEVQPFCIPACATGAPHRRDRIWFVAHTQKKGWRARNKRKPSAGQKCGEKEWNEVWNRFTNSSEDGDWLQAATRLCSVDDGLPRGLDGITIPRWRIESLKAYGNAIVPQIAYQIFQSIESCEMDSLR